MTDHTDDIARLRKTRKALIARSNQTGESVIEPLKEIQRSIDGMIDADIASARCEYTLDDYKPSTRDTNRSR